MSADVAKMQGDIQAGAPPNTINFDIQTLSDDYDTLSVNLNTYGACMFAKPDGIDAPLSALKSDIGTSGRWNSTLVSIDLQVMSGAISKDSQMMVYSESYNTAMEHCLAGGGSLNDCELSTIKSDPAPSF